MHPARLLLLGVFLSACGAREGDLPLENDAPDPAGKDHRISEIADPRSPDKARSGQLDVRVSGAVVVAIDQFDETRDGRSAGTIYVSDLGSTRPYSGISLFNPSFIPGNLRVSPGDALDLRGQFQENENVPIQFAKGSYLVQLANPIGTFRFEAPIQTVIEKDETGRDLRIEDFSEYDKGRKWLNTVVKLKNVRIYGSVFANNGRVSYNLMNMAGGGCTQPFPKAPTLVNELMDLEALQPPLPAEAGTEGVVVKSITGLVTFFCNLHIAPRTAADIER